MKFITRGTVAAALAVAGVIAGALNQAGLVAFFNSPATGDLVFGAITAISAIVAGISDGIKKPE